ncbi:thioesterase domain-containing protein [Solibacillus sp. CAU 1738]|uniref:thioesterase II family protein n=1 Tax=Solibacillus sp. CAU 1738 TaxID=3140363 RepID=UPI003261407B
MELKTFFKSKEGNKGQLICFPYLGGYVNSFYEIVRALSEDVEIWVANPPGHFGSQLELISDINELISLYSQDISKIIRPGSAFFGHSMGGIVSYFLLERMIQNQEKILPKTLILSASVAPSSFANKQYSKFSDEDLIKQIQVYGGMPEAVLKDKELMKIMLPIFRADYGILESSAKAPYKKIDIETHLLWGENDKSENFSSAIMWNDYLVQDLNVTSMKSAEHMFIHNMENEVVKYINQFMNLEVMKVKDRF